MPIPSAILTLVLGMILVLGGLWIGQNVNLLPVDASVNAPIYDELFRVLFSIGTILFVGIVGVVVFSLVRFRRKPGQIGDGIALEGNLPLEIFWTAVPAIVVLFVGLFSYDIYERMGGTVILKPVKRGFGEELVLQGRCKPVQIWRYLLFRLRSRRCNLPSYSIIPMETLFLENCMFHQDALFH